MGEDGGIRGWSSFAGFGRRPDLRRWESDKQRQWAIVGMSRLVLDCSGFCGERRLQRYSGENSGDRVRNTLPPANRLARKAPRVWCFADEG